MSDPEVPQHEQKSGVDDVVDSANAGLAEAEAARADQPQSADVDAVDHTPAGPATVDNTPVDHDAVDNTPVDHDAVDPDLAAFEAAERDHPGTLPAGPSAGTLPPSTTGSASTGRMMRRSPTPPMRRRSPTLPKPESSPPNRLWRRRVPRRRPTSSRSSFRRRSRRASAAIRGTAGAIGLLATIVFAILYLGIGLGWSALRGDIAGGEVVDVVLSTLTTWAFWVPVAVFFIGFWLLGAIINRGRWGLWVVFGLLVGVVSYGGYILGQLFEAPFWLITASEATTLVGDQLFAPLAIASFVLGRELTIWFGAWVARSGARKTELNDEAQREYERTLEAGPNLSR